MTKLDKAKYKKEFGYIRIARIIRPGSDKLNEILNTLGGIERVSELTLKEWIESRLLSTGELARIKKIDDDEIYAVIDYCLQNNIRIITPEDDEYPREYGFISNPPAVIYARGDRLDSSVPKIAIVGARKSTEFGNKAAYSLAARLAISGFTVISGGALGVDSMAHTGAMNAGGKTIVILGCGIDSDYLPLQEELRLRAEKNGTVISEFEPKTMATKYTFPIRNRLISALACGVAVIEAGLTSGALITATYAMEQGKDVFAVPGNIDYPQYGGTNQLLRDGATPLLQVENVIEVYLGRFPDKIKTGKPLTKEIKMGYRAEAVRIGKGAPKRSKKEREEDLSIAPAEKSDEFKPTNVDELTCSENAKKIYISFTNNTEFSDTLSKRSGISGGNFIAAITELELFGLVKAVPVGRYERIR